MYTYLYAKMFTTPISFHSFRPAGAVCFTGWSSAIWDPCKYRPKKNLIHFQQMFPTCKKTSHWQRYPSNITTRALSTFFRCAIDGLMLTHCPRSCRFILKDQFNLSIASTRFQSKNRRKKWWGCRTTDEYSEWQEGTEHDKFFLPIADLARGSLMSSCSR